MSERKYTEDHEWIAVESGVGTVGITEFAQEQLGDVVFVELPESGRTVTKGEQIAVVESVKAASEIYAPVSGEIVAGNDILTETPDTVNGDPLGKGWFFKIKLSDPAELDGLMDIDAYERLTAG